MKSAFAPLAAAALFVSGALAQFTINTPTNVVVCQPILLNWSGGTPPYFLSILPGSQPTAQALVDLGQQTGTSFTWTVNIAAGTSIGLNLRDSSGQTAQSAPFSINSGPDTSCVGKDPSSSGSAPPSTGSASGSGTPSGGTGATTSPPSAPSGTTTPISPPSTTPPGSSAPNTSSKPAGSTNGTSAPAPTNAASANGAHIGVAGFIGAVIVLLA